MRRVLLVESDRALARVIARALERRHRVTVVESVSAAVKALAGRGSSAVDVVVANYELGRRASGASLSRTVGARWPGIKRVVYASGEVPRENLRHAHAVVTMPGDFAELLRVVEE